MIQVIILQAPIIYLIKNSVMKPRARALVKAARLLPLTRMEVLLNKMVPPTKTRAPPASASKNSKNWSKIIYLIQTANKVFFWKVRIRMSTTLLPACRRSTAWCQTFCRSSCKVRRASSLCPRVKNWTKSQMLTMSSQWRDRPCFKIIWPKMLVILDWKNWCNKTVR